MNEKRFRKPKNIYPVLTMQHLWSGNKECRLVKFGAKPGMGGITLVTYETELGVVYEGRAYCSPKDSYAKRNGKSLALGRCLRAMPRALRSSVANEFIEKFGKINEQYVYSGLNNIPLKEVQEQAKKKLMQARAQLRQAVRPTPLLDRIAQQRKIRLERQKTRLQ